MAAAHAVVEGRKAVFLLPYRALVNEKYDQFSMTYGERLNWRVIRCSGDFLDDTGAFIQGKYDLALLTYEMFLNLVVSNSSIINQIGLVVLDEAQFITDPTRGVVVELLLTYLLTARRRGINPQLIALSAVIGNINYFDEWLGCQTLITDKRPVRLIEGVLDRSGILEFVGEAGANETSQYLPPSAIYIRRDKPRAQDVIVPLVRKLVADGEKVIVFRNRKGDAQGCAAYLAAELGLETVSEAIDALPTLDRATTSTTLQQCLQGGTAFHNANLTREERVIVEQAFRDPHSKLRVLAATTTVAAGINTPAATVILAENEFLGEDGRPFTVAEYKNMAGRAGRLGFNEVGKAIILAHNEYERRTLFNQYVRGQLEHLKSSFDPQRLETWLVRLLAQVKRVLRKEVINLLLNTYGGHVANRNEPGWRATMESRLAGLLNRMIELGLVEEENQYVQLTLLGRACGQSSLEFESSLRLVEMLRSIPASDMTAVSLMALVQALPELDRTYTPLMRRGNGESVRVSQAVSRYGQNTVRLLQKFASTFHDYYARCKRAAILWDWINGNPIEEIEVEFTTNPYVGKIEYGSVRSFADATRFYLTSASQVANLIYLGQSFNAEEMSTLLKQLEYGIPAGAVGLLKIPTLLTRGEYLVLFTAGLHSVEETWTLSQKEIEGLLGTQKAKRLELFRPDK
jgi:replicative superfamily II helicase